MRVAIISGVSLLITTLATFPGAAQQANEHTSTGMIGANPQRNRVYDLPPLPEPKAMAWRTTPLFSVSGPGAAMIFGPFGNTLSGAYATSPGHGAGELIVAGDAVFFTIFINDGYVIAQDRRKGTDMWRFKQKGVRLSSPAIVGDRVFVGAMNGSIYALDAATGEEKWSTPKKKYGRFLSSPIYAEETLYLTYIEEAGQYPARPDGMVIAVDPQNGKQKWAFKTKGNLTKPAYKSGVLFVGGDQGHVHAIDGSSGKQLWQKKMGRGFQAPVVSQDAVFLITFDGAFLALDAKNGTELWKSERLPLPATLPAVLNGQGFYCGKDKHLYSFGQKGELKWTYSTEAECRTPIVAAGVVYIASEDGAIHAIDSQAGIPKWRVKALGKLLLPPAISADTLYFMNAENRLHAVR